MLRSLRLLSSEPLWKRLFIVERPAELDYTRCFKDLSDPLRALLTLKEAAAGEFRSMTDLHMLKTLSVLGYLHYHSRRIKKEMQQIDLFWAFAKKRLEAGEINWTPSNISFLCEFITNSPAYATSRLQPSLLPLIYSTAFQSPMRLSQFSYVVTSAFHYPSFYSSAYSDLLTRVNQPTDFSQMNSNDLRILCKALFIRPSPSPLPPVSTSLFTPTTLTRLQTAVITRLTKGQLDIEQILDIMKSFQSLGDKTVSEFDVRISDWILRVLDSEEGVNMDSIDQDPMRIMELVGNLAQVEPLSKLIFRLAANRLFFNFIFAKGSHAMTIGKDRKLEVLRMYLSQSARNQLFQVVFLDQTVETLVSQYCSKGFFEGSFQNICSILNSLAELNYTDRFKMMHTQVRKENWEKLIEACEMTIVKKLKEETSNTENDEDFSHKTAEKQLLLSLLWSFAVLNRPSKSVLPLLLPKLLTLPPFSDSDLTQLAQIHLWLHIENHSEFQLPQPILDQINTAKVRKNEENYEEVKEKSELYRSVELWLQGKGRQVKGRKADFPYFVTFAGDGEEKECIELVENCVLDGSEGQIWLGSCALRRRQLPLLGWEVRWESLESWLS